MDWAFIFLETKTYVLCQQPSISKMISLKIFSSKHHNAGLPISAGTLVDNVNPGLIYHGLLIRGVILQ
jgi:hypothetical protein